MERKHGTILLLKKEKGYGFIKPDGAKSYQDNIFFHASRVANKVFEELTESQAVEYTEEEGRKGIMAVNVILVE